MVIVRVDAKMSMTSTLGHPVAHVLHQMVYAKPTRTPGIPPTAWQPRRGTTVSRRVTW